MPDSLLILMILSLIIGFLSFIGLVWREKASDEREATHIGKSGRLAFFMGATILVVGIVFQSVQHDIDPWLLYALFSMVLAKIIARSYHNRCN